ncbi:phytanoyl-CoA dioxygenase family protein [Paenibacillus ginsengarvi]|uniref:Mitomycin antibiotic biosynthesis protein n=1 Tax=Paenibacillus ginsengarvi TaxID=400777 RepID=A0A3B0AYP0_9BACL|nr:phytanoyl-CoA dioxygenase family protein [Paenibacillus ginsengarvi]RKN65156.1 mitomycin antibiotic biosynthesis protein [Paenibacillus ginsengarvi]
MALTMEQVIRFQTEGYLIAENVFTEEDMRPLIEEIESFIEERAQQFYKEGRITNLYPDEPFERRFALLYEQCPDINRKFDIMHLLGPAMFNFLTNPKLLDVAECLLGSELSCNPIQHLRSKMPWKGEGEQAASMENVPWHQDAAVTAPESEASEIYTFWLPLIDVTRETGCMEIIPHSFKNGYLKHQAEGGTTIVNELLPTLPAITAACKRGSIVIMNKYTPHRGTSNRSDFVRWSLDLRYHKTGAHSGRDFHPSFVARSRLEPDSVLTDANEWRQIWKDALAKPAQKAHRV